MSDAVKKAAAANAAAKAGLMPLPLLRNCLPFKNPAMPLAAWSRTQSRFAKPKAQSRAIFENAGGEVAEETPEEEEIDIEETENRSMEKELLKNNRI